MWIDRDLQSRITELCKAFPAVLITGARQTGKTSLLRHSFPDAPFISLDLPSNAQLAEEQPEQLLAGLAEPLIFDEVQYAPGLFRFLKVDIDRDRARMGRFLMTGSQRFALMQHVSESLAGRIGIVELDTLSSRELIEAKVAPGTETLWRGGFPELYRNPELRPRDFYSSYVATYLDRDVRPAVRAGSLRDFERFLRACAIHSGKLLNYSSLGSDLGIAAGTIRNWLSILQASNQILLLEPWFGNLHKRMIKTPKLYLRDTGLLSFLLGFDSAQSLADSTAIGAVWETFVVNQIIRQFEASGVPARMFFLRELHGREVDIVVERNARLQLIEAKWTQAFAPIRSAQIDKVASSLGPDLLAAQHLIVARPSQEYPLSGTPNVQVVNGFTYDFTRNA